MHFEMFGASGASWEAGSSKPWGAGGGLGRNRYCRVRRGGPHDHAPAQDGPRRSLTRRTVTLPIGED